VSCPDCSAVAGRWAEAQELHRRFHSLFSYLLSLDTNPVPVKAGLAMMGRVEEVYRLPLCPMESDKKQRLQECMKALGLLL